MIDTIRLKFNYDLPRTDYFKERILKKELYLAHITGHRYAWTNNRWRKQRQKAGQYAPKYWIEQAFKNPSKTFFCFEASLPKLLNQENITPLYDYQFDEVVKKIKDFCKEIGVYIFEPQIRNVKPTLLAIGKTINLGELCSCNAAIKALKSFDYKSHTKHRIVDFSDHKNGGRELIFSTKSETCKVYDKTKEILNHINTTREGEMAELIKNDKFKIDGQQATQILRFELTLKNTRKIRQRVKPYLGSKTPTFQTLFKQKIWDALLQEEIDGIFNHPLQKIIFLSLENQPFIDGFLDKHYKHIQTKDTIRGILASLRELGLAETRKKYLSLYKSRQTWYNYLRRLERLQEHFDWQALRNLTNVDIHSYILDQFGITSASQQELDLIYSTTVSKKIDAKPRNTRYVTYDLSRKTN